MSEIESLNAIFGRRFGSRFPKPCLNPKVLECAFWDCQKANECQLHAASRRAIGTQIVEFDPARASSAPVNRITPYKDGGSIEERIDEIVQSGSDVHFEALDESMAMLVVGRYHFRIEARKGKLFCWLYEEEEP